MINIKDVDDQKWYVVDVNKKYIVYGPFNTELLALKFLKKIEVDPTEDNSPFAAWEGRIVMVNYG